MFSIIICGLLNLGCLFLVFALGSLLWVWVFTLVVVIGFILISLGLLCLCFEF